MQRQNKRAQILSQKKNQKYQMVLKQCAAFPYSRTQEAYEEAAECVVTYRDICQEANRQSYRFIMHESSIVTGKSGLSWRNKI